MFKNWEQKLASEAPVKSINPFVPYLATLKDIVDLTFDIKLFSLEIDDPLVREGLSYKPGQFGFVSAFGVGESPFGISSVDYRKNGVEFAIRRVGTVSNALHRLEAGARVGLRGPFGNYFPLDDYRGKNILVIGGGIGMAPLRPVINTLLDHRSDYKDILIVNGARSPQDLVFASEFEGWAAAPNTRLELTVDRGDEAWTGKVALIPDVVTAIAPSPEHMVAIICGPPIMIRFTMAALKRLGFADDQIVTTLEAKMKCGLGKCARCNVGETYICKSGPVFTLEQIANMLEPI